MTDLPIQATATEFTAGTARLAQPAHRVLSIAWLMLRDLVNGLVGAGIPLSRALEMIYVDPYRNDRADGGGHVDSPVRGSQDKPSRPGSLVSR